VAGARREWAPVTVRVRHRTVTSAGRNLADGDG